MKAIILSLFMIFVLIFAANVLAQTTFSIYNEARMIDPVIEHQTADGHIVWPPDEYTVVNPVRNAPDYCVWDVDDWTHAFGTGEIAEGQSVNYSQCLIISDSHLFSMSTGIRGGNNHWQLSISIPELGWSISAIDAKRLCIVGINFTQQLWDQMPIVPGSDNGDGIAFGKGRFVHVVRTITNLGQRRIRDVKADYTTTIIQTPQQVANYCGLGQGVSSSFGNGYSVWYLSSN